MGNQDHLYVREDIHELREENEKLKAQMNDLIECLRCIRNSTFVASVVYLENYQKEWGEMGTAKSSDACFDLRAAISEPIRLGAGEWAVVPNGFKIDVGHGKELQIRPRSGLAAKYGITVLNAPGTVDAGYRGEVMTPIINLGKSVHTIYPGARISQAVIKYARDMQLISVENLDDSERGEGGFGHTGA